MAGEDGCEDRCLQTLHVLSINCVLEILKTFQLILSGAPLEILEYQSSDQEEARPILEIN